MITKERLAIIQLRESKAQSRWCVRDHSDTKALPPPQKKSEYKHGRVPGNLLEATRASRHHRNPMHMGTAQAGAALVVFTCGFSPLAIKRYSMHWGFQGGLDNAKLCSLFNFIFKAIKTVG